MVTRPEISLEICPVIHITENTRRTNIVLMLSQRRRQWGNIKSTLGHCFLWYTRSSIEKLTKHWFNVVPMRDPPD